MNKVQFFSNNHKKIKRAYLDRMTNNKVSCMKLAKKFSKDYWDGDRKYGYGGYIYDGRFSEVAEKIISKYKLDNKSSILDFGCGKGYLLYEIHKICNCKIWGIDISSYAIKNAKLEIRDYLQEATHRDLVKFSDHEFDLFISNMTLHNLSLSELSETIVQISRISKNSLLTFESYRDDQELFNLQCWALTCKTFFSESDWDFFLQEKNYQGDYELMYFE